MIIFRAIEQSGGKELEVSSGFNKSSKNSHRTGFRRAESNSETSESGLLEGFLERYFSIEKLRIGHICQEALRKLICDPIKKLGFSLLWAPNRLFWKRRNYSPGIDQSRNAETWRKRSGSWKKTYEKRVSGYYRKVRELIHLSFPDIENKSFSLKQTSISWKKNTGT